jgi:hypothetical protein
MLTATSCVGPLAELLCAGIARRNFEARAGYPDTYTPTPLAMGYA